MQIALPKKISYQKGTEDNKGDIIIEPCFPGYGITLGNSLRRVLHSSLTGAAPIGVKIKGVDHEFMSLPHLKEDILEFILNLKGLKLKVFSDERIKIELNIHGKKEITAGDITKSSDFEILNPELVLGHITDMAGSLEAEILVDQGLGYETIETRENKEKEVGFIEMDSLYSPVLAVGIKVENVRVGKMTNWDKLILDVKTDGTMTPEEAFKLSVDILMEQFAALKQDEKAEKKSKKKEDKEEKEEVAAVKEEKEEKKEKKETKKKK